MAEDPKQYSRFQVRCEGLPAWAIDHKRKQFYYDGLRFWSVAEGGTRRVKTSWEAPVHGWVHDTGCACDLCEREGAKQPQWAA